MKILMISPDYIPSVGGIAAHTYELSQALLKLGCNISIATRHLNKTQLQFEKLEGINIHRFKLCIGALHGYQINKFIKNIIAKEDFDIIHIHGMRPLEFYNIKSIPLVYTNHTSGFLKRIKKGGYCTYLLKRLFSRPQLFLAPSEELLDIPFEIKAKKVFISNGVVSEKFTRNEEKRQIIRQQLKIKDNEKLAIVTRRMVWKNGVNFLAQATQYIKNDNFKILFVGIGEQYNDIKTILEKHFKGKFILLGEKQHHEIIDYYSAADLSILPSLMEATSISGLEAMAASLPLVGTKVGGIPVILKDGENGYLCESQNPIDLAEKIDLLLDKNIKKMGEVSKKMVNDSFDWLGIAQQTLNEYKELTK